MSQTDRVWSRSATMGYLRALFCLAVAALVMAPDCEGEWPPVDPVPTLTAGYIATGAETKAFEVNIAASDVEELKAYSNWRITCVATYVLDYTTKVTIVTEDPLIPPPTTTSNRYSVFWPNGLDIPPLTSGQWQIDATVYANKQGTDEQWDLAGQNQTTIIRRDDNKETVLFLGDGRYASSGQVVGWEGCYALYMQVRNTQTGIGVDGLAVTWDCSNQYVQLTTDPETRRIDFNLPDGPTFLHGMASCQVYFGPGCLAGENEVTASVSDLDDVVFKVECTGADDLDCLWSGGNIVPNLHEINPATNMPYAGDGLWDAADLNPQYKDIRLEIDYYDDGRFTLTRISKALELLLPVYQDYAGIALLPQYQALQSPIDEDMDEDEVRGQLAVHQDDAYAGRGKGYLHVIASGGIDEARKGITSCYGRVSYFTSMPWLDAMRLGSTELSDDGRNDYLKRCGCYVFRRPFIYPNMKWMTDNPAPEDPSPYGMYGEEYFAVILGHEIGHAMGLAHLDENPDRGLMTAHPDPAHNFAYYAWFSEPTDEEKRQVYQINLRKLVGRDVVELFGNLTWTPEQ